MSILFDLGTWKVPQELKDLKWCGWGWFEDKDKQKWTKPPLNPYTNKHLQTNNPASWLAYKDVEHLEKKGFLLTKDSLICVIDVDGCRNSKTGVIAPWGWKIIEQVNSYTEVSPSGTGVHIIAYGTKPDNAKSRFCLEGHEIEVYDCNQYITYTGEIVDIYSFIRNAQDWIDENVPLKTTCNNTPKDLALEVPELELSDSEIVQKLSSFSYGDKFEKLYEGDWQGSYPSQSEADLALCFYLAFMTKNEEQIDRIFRNSDLYRSKWDRSYYSNRTINYALNSNTDFYIPSVSKQMVEELFSIRLRLKWNKFSLSYIYGALLSIAHKHSGVSDEGVLVFASTRDIKLLSGININGKQLSALIRELQNLGLIKILEIGAAGKATEYLLYSPDHVHNHLNKYLIDVCIPFHLCLMMWVQNELHLQYQKTLNPTQKAVVELIMLQRCSVGELAAFMGMRKNNFKSRVLKNLEQYIKVDKKEVMTPRRNIQKTLEKNFDKVRYKTLRDEIKKEREEYNNKMLLAPLQRYLNKMEKEGQQLMVDYTL